VLNRIFLGEHTDYLVRHAELGDVSALASRQAELDTRPFAKGDRAWISWSKAAPRVLARD